MANTRDAMAACILSLELGPCSLTKVGFTVIMVGYTETAVTQSSDVRRETLIVFESPQGYLITLSDCT